MCVRAPQLLMGGGVVVVVSYRNPPLSYCRATRRLLSIPRKARKMLPDCALAQDSGRRCLLMQSHESRWPILGSSAVLPVQLQASLLLVSRLSRAAPVRHAPFVVITNALLPCCPLLPDPLLRPIANQPRRRALSGPTSCIWEVLAHFPLSGSEERKKRTGPSCRASHLHFRPSF